MEKRGSGQKGIRIMVSAGSAMTSRGEGGPRDIPFIWWGDLQGWWGHRSEEKEQDEERQAKSRCECWLRIARGTSR